MRRLLSALGLVALLAAPLAGFASEQTVPNGMARIGATPNGRDYAQIGVAVLDTGIQYNHPDLNVVGGVDCTHMPSSSPLGTGEFTVPAEGPFGPLATDPKAPAWTDGFGHGTHVAGIIAAKDNGIGVVGAAPNASLYSVRVLDESGSGSNANVMCGLDWVIEYHERIDVVNMSLGMTGLEYLPTAEADCATEVKPRLDDGENTRPRSLYHDKFCQIIELGIPIVVSAGNNLGDAGYNRPAGYTDVITVSNFADYDGKPGGEGVNEACPRVTSWDDTLSSDLNGGGSSNFGQVVDFAAPGTCVYSTLPSVFGPGYGYATGTSMAAPTVTGVVARMLGDRFAVQQDLVAFRGRAGGAFFVKYIETMLLASSEPQMPSFHDVDRFPEPIIHVVREP